MAVAQASKPSREADRELLNRLGQPALFAFWRWHCVQRSDDGVSDRFAPMASLLSLRFDYLSQTIRGDASN
jgi:hypothetical protein